MVNFLLEIIQTLQRYSDGGPPGMHSVRHRDNHCQSHSVLYYTTTYGYTHDTLTDAAGGHNFNLLNISKNKIVYYFSGDISVAMTMKNVPVYR